MWKLMLIAGMGGFLGTCSRFLVNRLFFVIWHTSYPLATFTINILGCFLFGIISGIMNKTGIIDARINAFLIVGFCGGFTTFSTFSFESYNLCLNGELLSMFLYILASVIIGLIAVWAGLLITR